MLSREIINIFGSKTFMKVKANAFGIHKVLLSFGEFDPNTKALSKSIDFYIDANKFRVFCQDVLSGRLIKLAKKEAEKNPKFPLPAYTVQGGTSAEKANRPDGRPEARVFKFSQSNTAGFYLFQCESGPGKQSPEGLISLDGKAEKRIMVRCSIEDLKSLCLSVPAEYDAYLASCYGKDLFDYKKGE